MSPDTNDGAAAPPAEDDDVERYAILDLIDGGLVLYDRENHRAWVQSSTPVELASMA